MSQIEVEKRVILTTSQKTFIERSLQKMHVLPNPEEKLHDIYFCRNNITSFDQISMEEVGSYSLRLRERKTGKKIKIEMNTKVIISFADHTAWEEHEIQIDSLKEGYNLLLSLGFKAFYSLKKIRKSYHLEKRDIQICIENIENFGPVLEIEILTTREKKDQAKEEIDSLLQELQISSEQIVPKTITNMLMTKNAVFDNSLTYLQIF